MNLHQIIHELSRLKTGDRRRRLVELEVDHALWPAIMECFNQDVFALEDTIRVRLTDHAFPVEIVDAVVLENNCIKFKDDKGIWHYTMAWELVQTEKLPGLGERALTDGERWQDGDEYWDNEDGKWMPVPCTWFGTSVDDCDVGRRSV